MAAANSSTPRKRDMSDRKRDALSAQLQSDGLAREQKNVMSWCIRKMKMEPHRCWGVRDLLMSELVPGKRKQPEKPLYRGITLIEGTKRNNGLGVWL
eukprot:2549758-Lingulodinium_polyedra.AAC.1